MYIIDTDVKLKKGSYVDLDLKDGMLSFVKDNKEVFRTEIREEDKKRFKNRRLKGLVKGKEKGFYKISIQSFANLHIHSAFSLLDGGVSIEELVKLTTDVSALTDHGNMFAFLKFWKAMKKAGKQAIVGIEAYVETITGEKKSNHLVLLVKNQVGYKNLIKLTSASFNNFYMKPHITLDMLKERSEGIICLSGCLGGEISRNLANSNYEGAREVAEMYRDIFKDDFYLEIQKHNLGQEEELVNKGLIELSKELNIKLVATTDSHYGKIEDKEHHEMLLALSTGTTLSDERRMKFSGDGYHLHSEEEMNERFKFIPEAIDNTLEVAEKCAEFELQTGKTYFPKFDIPEGFTEDSYFEHLVSEGFKERFKDSPEIYTSKEYYERLKREVETIKEMGYSAYFLIVWDFIKYAKDKGIMVGPGRGSAAGSLASYCLQITDLDPIPYGLLFERFLNPERVSLPDIDVDFCYERRGEVIDYVRRKYGEDAVSGIVTFGTFAARSAVRDVTRVMEFPYSLGDEIAKAIPATPGMTINNALEESPELQKLYNDNTSARTIIDRALKIEGLPKNSSTHACGIVISNTSVDNYMPEFMSGNVKEGKEITTQVTMSEVEELGLLKFDFLGLKTMSIIGRTIKDINKTTEKSINYLDIPMDDPYIYEYIGTGKTEGVFQLESPGMRGFMKELYSDVSYLIKRTENKYNLTGFSETKGEGKEVEKYKVEMKKIGQELFERLIAGISLYRPGPLDYIPNYLEGIRNPDTIEYLVPELKPILEATYGTIVYQEQVMQIVQTLAGYSLGRADIIRRAMGKKNAKTMEEEKNYFINGKLDDDGNVEVPGCVRNGIKKSIAEEIWEQMAHFSSYAFNKSHGAVYAMLGAITAWLKKYYPSIFMAHTMNIFNGDSDKLRMYLNVTNEMGMKILPPNLNSSNKEFSSNGKDVLFGLGAIKFMGQNSDFIIEERMKRGEFGDIADFVERMVTHQQTNKRALEGLVYSGALDSYQGTRRAKIEALSELIEGKKKVKNNNLKDQVSIFDMMPELDIPYNMPHFDEFDKRFKLEKEKEYAGFYVTEHPLDEILPSLADNNITNISDLSEEVEDIEDEIMGGIVVESFDGRQVDLVGILSDVKTFYTKKTGEPLKVFQIEDKGGQIKGVMFNNNIDQFGGYLTEGNIVVLSGTIKEDDFGRQIIVNSVKDIEAIKTMKVETFLHVKAINEKQLKDFNERVLSLEKYRGDEAVYVSYRGKTFKSDNKINIKAIAPNILREIFTDNNYKIKKQAI